jgi:PAS domain S-box-containing protein
VATQRPLSDAQLVELLERVPDVIWRYRVAPQPGFDYVSPSIAALTGYSPAEHYADPRLSARILHPDDRSVVEAVIAEPDDHPVVIVRWRHKDGRVVPTEHRITAVRDGRGRIVAVEGVARPVTSADRRFQIQAGELIVDLAMQRVLAGGRLAELTPTEHRLIAVLAGAEGVVPVATLVSELWGSGYAGGARAVQVHISNLRRKLEDDPRSPRRIVTVRGRGYALAPRA